MPVTGKIVFGAGLVSSRLALLGGSTVGNTTRHMLREMFTNHMVLTLNFAGRGNEVGIGSMNVVAGRTPKGTSKMAKLLQHRSCCQEKKMNDVTYLVKSQSWKDGKIVHVDKLRPVRHFQ